MPATQETMPSPPNPKRSAPSLLQLLLILLLLAWLFAATVAVALLTALLPAAWPELPVNFWAVAVLSVLLLIPWLGLTLLAYWRRWRSFMPFVQIFGMTSIYLVVATALRSVLEQEGQPDTILYLTVLTLTALAIGGLGLRLAGVPGSAVMRTNGFGQLSFTSLFLGVSLMAIVTVGWPLTGALGDSWTSLIILLQALAIILPQEIFFRGAVFGLLAFNFPSHRTLVAFISFFVYLAFLPSLLVPASDWSKLGLVITAVSLALLTTELRMSTGSIWVGILFAWIYRAVAPLFTDPRVELPLITQPWQTAAYFWMVVSTAGLALFLWLARTFLASWRRPSRWAWLAVALGGALFSGALWLGLWHIAGYPGFHNDGFLIIMSEQADLAGAEAIDDPVARRKFVRDRLIATAQQVQAPIRARLDEVGMVYRPFYLINMIRVEGNHRRMAEFADLPGVAEVVLNPSVRPYPFSVALGYGNTPGEGQGVGWNISQVEADDVWGLGFTGQGIVVGGQDTGYDWEHPALRQAYRGNSGNTVEHAYNWRDAWSEIPVPFDDDQHGTHTMGTIVGDDGLGNQIGMAPGAQWIGCRNMLRGLGNPASYTDCMEFFLAPYPPGGDPFRDGDVSLAPHLVNNSWGCPEIEGCDDDILLPALDALRAAGIMMVVSAGNSGPGCQTVAEPPARYDSAFSVGATDSLGQITGFSSRGPVPNSASLLKPDVVAPGSNVRSSLPGGRYGTAGGTSMAGPHVAGLVALMWSANPELVGQIGATEEIIRRSATPIVVNASCSAENQAPDSLSLLEQGAGLDHSAACACGGVAGLPNNVYGWGEIDALTAVELALEWKR